MNAVYWLAAGDASGETAGEILGGAGMTALIGMVVVFAALIALTLIFWLFGKVVGRGGGGKAASVQAPAPPPAPRAAAPAPSAAPRPAVGDGVDDEIVAVIAAAVAAMAPAGKRYAVRRVSRAGGGRPVWAQAGLAESTRPF